MPNALPRELGRNAAVGIEPTLFGPEVTHSLATGTVVLQISEEKQHGSYLQASRLAEWRFPFPPLWTGSIPRLRHRRCSRQGKIVCGYCGFEPHPCGLRPKKYPHTSPLAHGLQTGVPGTRFFAWWGGTRGNGRYLRSSRVKKYPRATPLAIAGKLFALYRLSGLSRGTTRRYLLAVGSRIHDEPTMLSSRGCIRCPNWRVVVITTSSA
jgi:hypothetical protein